MSIYLLIKHPQTEEEFIANLLNRPQLGILDCMYDENGSITFTPVHLKTSYYRYPTSYKDQKAEKGARLHKISKEGFCKLYRHALQEDVLILRDWLIKSHDQKDELIRELEEEQADRLIEKCINRLYSFHQGKRVEPEKTEVKDGYIGLDLAGHPVAPRVRIKISDERLERLIDAYKGNDENREYETWKHLESFLTKKANNYTSSTTNFFSNRINSNEVNSNEYNRNNTRNSNH